MSRVPSGNGSRVKSVNDGRKEKEPTNGHQQKNNKKKEEPASDSSDDEPFRAPIQLKLEFVNSIMFHQWALAKKLCQFMLMYEPNNNEAKQYAPLIDFMLNKEQSLSSSDEDDDDEDDDDDTSDDSSESSDSSDSSANEEKNKVYPIETQAPKPVNASLSNKCTPRK